MTFAQSSGYGADLIASGRTALGIELGSTRIKACLVDAADPSVILAVGAYAWENSYVDGVWTYAWRRSATASALPMRRSSRVE
jgi:sugar (pentulose or hexulose) kinase